jgi:Rrf2 family transcriptional regulator, iron-sulfur cluster assembly transcription factor
MLRLSRKSLLALEAVIDIAYSARAEPVQAKEITARQGVPQRYLEQVMQQLVRAGILRGVRGPRGGYRLARERRRISIGDVVRIAMAIDEAEEDFDGGSELGRKVVVPLIASLQEEIMKKLDEMTIEDVCRRARNLNLAPGSAAIGEADADFTI